MKIDTANIHEREQDAKERWDGEGGRPAALDNDRNLSRQDISILTLGRVVYLRGFADTLEQVERAGTLARRVEFVSAVSNAIRMSDRPNRA
jgi:hypothetical protein